MAGHCGSTMTVICLSHLILLLSVVDFSCAQRPGKYIPTITDVSAIDNQYLREDLPIGYVLGQIKAVDADGTAVSYYIRDNGGEFFAVDPVNGTVTLKKLLDFETAIEIKSVIYVTDQNGQSNTRDCKVFVIDVNDNPPVFTDTAIFRSISEAERPGFIVTLVSVTDIDTVNVQLQVTCGGNTTLFQDACGMFRVVVSDSTNKYWRGSLVLNKSLDYETRNAYNIRLIAFDGIHYVSNEVHVEVVDINDTPPKWNYVGPKSIPEEQPVGTSVQQVTAVDGDSTNPRQIRYDMCSANSDVFQVDNTTGIISNAKRLDYDGTEHEKGVPYDICIRAREVINITSGQLGNDPITTATISLRVTVEDINDNGPVFSQKEYVAYVDENIATGSNIPGLQMTVTDIDSGTYNSFGLSILNNTNVFGIIPSSDAATSSATIYITGGINIDYESGPKQYIIDVRAIQNFLSPTNPKEPTGSATVTVYVRDVNDVTPTFEQAAYYYNVSETATPSTVIATIRATDPEEGNFGTAGIRYKLYGDNTPPHFQIDDITGVVTVAPCSQPNQPGIAPCIDYERKRDYTLTVSATDNIYVPVSRSRSVQLFIKVLDENDNVPKIDTSYIRYINEDQSVTINPLLIEPVDPDTVGGPLTFTINGDQSGLWQVTPMTDSNGRQYGNITATRPIKYSDAKYPNGEFNFAVVVGDQSKSSTALVKIIVIDINDNRPEFIPRNFDVTIPETTKGDVFIVKVTATDADAPTTGNGIIDFSIQSGAQGKFTITNVTLRGNEFVADIYTTKDAVFNYETQNIYNMMLIARDRGSPLSLFGTANLTVRILDDNNRDPQIQPSFQSVSVYENEPVGRTIYQVTATDPDVNNKLAFYFSAKEATDGSGDIVNSAVYDFTKLFRIEEGTGYVVVNSPLDRDKASRITYDLMAVDTNARPLQSGNGTLLIHVLEFNDKAPSFDSYPAYYITIDEELNINSYVQNLNCRDQDDSIAGYTITQTNPTRPLYFSLLPGSGAMIVSYRIDFEEIEQIELTAQCTDSGQPSLSNTTKVIVYIRNINDNSPEFSQSLYQTTVRENTAGGTLNVTVSAKDIDKGDYGVVRYTLNDPYRYFSIDEITGVITINPNVTFDREKAGFLAFQVIAYDSPLNASVRRNSTAQVYVTIEDVNDNCPIFSRPFFVGKVPESADIDTDILDIIATDADEGLNGQLAFTVKNGSGVPKEAEDYFGIGTDSGRVFVKSIIKDKIGFYNLTIIATDMRGMYPGVQCSSEVPIQIEIQQSNNHAPQWIRPPNRNFVIYVLESQYDGMLVYSAKAVDNDVGPNGVVHYYFIVGRDQRVAATPEFRINNVTGVIRAEVVFDREQRDNYVLNLIAQDDGYPSSSTETTLIIVILDVNDNDPMFAMKNGAVEPLTFSASESMSKLPYELGRCNASDADSDVENNHIYYELLAARNEIKDYISVDNTTCAISLIKALNYENMPVLQFDILAYNKKNDDSVKRNKREVNPSIQPVIVQVENSNDNAPVFSKTSYKECVSIDAPLLQKIVQVSATDVDAEVGSSITFSISKSNEFQIDQNGYISNIVSFRNSPNGPQTYNLNAFASDGSKSATASVTIFVTSKENTAVLNVNQPFNDVLTFKQQIRNALIDSSKGAISYACVVDVKKHINDDGQASTVSSDVYVAAFRNASGMYVPYSAAELTNYVNTQRQSGSGATSALDSVYVTGAKEESKSDKFILEEDAVLAVLIICILLLFLAILLLCIACICIRNSNKKKKNNIKAASHTIVHVQEPLETSVNPVYNVGSTSEFASEPVEYSTVKKVRPVATAFSPVVVPSPMLEEETSYITPAEPPRVYAEDPYLEPVIETEVEPEPEVETEPIFETEVETEPIFETEVETEPIFETEVVREPYIETEFEPDPVYETNVKPEPVFETIERQPSPAPFEHTPRHFSEYEERLDHAADDDYESPIVSRVSFPEAIEEEEPSASYYPSPPASFSHLQPDYDSN